MVNPSYGGTFYFGELCAVGVRYTSCPTLLSIWKGLLLSCIPKFWVLLKFLDSGIGTLLSSPTYCFSP